MVNRLSHYFGFAMVAVYVALGLLFLFTDAAAEIFPLYRKALGAVMLVYASYRSYTIYKKIKNSN
jgi:hypothetical protein